MKQLRNKQSGFTLIEVVLVLAIGALIILMAVLAFSGAQRSRRDTARANLAGSIQSSVEQSASNTGGTYPTAGEFTTMVTTNSWKDPKTGVPTSGNTIPASNTAGIVYVAGGTCTDAKTLGATGDQTTPSTYAIVYRQESNQLSCRSN